MWVKALLTRLDKILCAYIGLDKEEVKPNTVQVIGEELVITSTSTFKRHVFNESWENYSTSLIKHTNNIDREKLGLAAGKAIAKKLVVSFEELTIKQK